MAAVGAVVGSHDENWIAEFVRHAERQGRVRLIDHYGVVGVIVENGEQAFEAHFAETAGVHHWDEDGDPERADDVTKTFVMGVYGNGSQKTSPRETTCAPPWGATTTSTS